MANAQEQQQREAIAMLLMQEIEKLKASLAQDPSSYDNWFAMGEMALEIALAITGEEAHTYLMEALKAFEKALQLDPTRPEAMVQYGSTLNMKAFSLMDQKQASTLFNQSTALFKKALELDPENEKYAQLVEAMKSAPELHNKVMSEMKQAQTMVRREHDASPHSESFNRAVDPAHLHDMQEPSGISSALYRLAGWAIVIGGIAAIYSRMSKSAAAPPQ